MKTIVEAYPRERNSQCILKGSPPSASHGNALVKSRECAESWRLLSPTSRGRSRSNTSPHARAVMVMRGLRCVLAGRPALVMVTRRSLTIIINIQTTRCERSTTHGPTSKTHGPLSKVPTAIRSLAIFNLFSSPLYSSLSIFLTVFVSLSLSLYIAFFSCSCIMFLVIKGLALPSSPKLSF